MAHKPIRTVLVDGFLCDMATNQSQKCSFYSSLEQTTTNLQFKEEPFIVTSFKLYLPASQSLKETNIFSHAKSESHEVYWQYSFLVFGPRSPFRKQNRMGPASEWIDAWLISSLWCSIGIEGIFSQSERGPFYFSVLIYRNEPVKPLWSGR